MVWQWHISWHCDNVNFVLKMFLRNCKGYYVKVEIYFYTKFNGVHLFSKTHLFCSFFFVQFFFKHFLQIFFECLRTTTFCYFCYYIFWDYFSKRFLEGFIFLYMFFVDKLVGLILSWTFFLHPSSEPLR